MSTEEAQGHKKRKKMKIVFFPQVSNSRKKMKFPEYNRKFCYECQRWESQNVEDKVKRFRAQVLVEYFSFRQFPSDDCCWNWWDLFVPSLLLTVGNWLHPPSIQSTRQFLFFIFLNKISMQRHQSWKEPWFKGNSFHWTAMISTNTSGPT